jgi:hypothetical protein
MQEHFRTRNEISPADRQEDALGARRGGHAPMKLRIARVLDHNYILHRFLEHLLECGGYGARQYVAAPDQERESDLMIRAAVNPSLESAGKTSCLSRPGP